MAFGRNIRARVDLPVCLAPSTTRTGLKPRSSSAHDWMARSISRDMEKAYPRDGETADLL